MNNVRKVIGNHCMENVHGLNRDQMHPALRLTTVMEYEDEYFTPWKTASLNTIVDVIRML